MVMSGLTFFRVVHHLSAIRSQHRLCLLPMPTGAALTRSWIVSAVLLQWTYSYFTYKRGARIITPTASPPKT